VNTLVVVTDRRQAEASGRRLGDVVAAALAGGARSVLLREKDLPPTERARLAADLRLVTAAVGADLCVASDVDLALAVGADGVHLAAADPWPDPVTQEALDERAPGHRVHVSRSCHTLDELVAADTGNADWVTYSPVFASASKPGYGPPLGLEGLAAACRAVPLPVLALGGVDLATARGCMEAGAAGVAVMGAVMRAEDPEAVVRALVDEVTAGHVARGQAMIDDVERAER
jgi:thiamine-phosphate pyrophosphorylase